MSLLTDFLGLFKYDPTNDLDETFNIDTALNDNWDKIDSSLQTAHTKLGDFTNLLTTVKDSVVNAINEIFNKVGDLTNLNTTNRDDLVSALNEVINDVAANSSLIASSVTYKGGYDASANAPDLDSSPSGVELGDLYIITTDGIFFTIDVEAGDMIVAEVDDANTEADWTVVNKNIDSQQIATNADNIDNIKVKTDYISITQTVDLDQIDNDLTTHTNNSEIHTNITSGTSDPSGGSDGDIYLQYE